MSVRCKVICDDGLAPAQHDFPLMPRVGSVFAFPGQYAIFEVSEILNRREMSPGGDGLPEQVVIIVRKRLARVAHAG